MGVFRQFPYSNFHEMNMDEIIKIVKNMLEEWAQYYAEWDAWMAEINDDWSNYQEVMNEAWQNMQDFINNYFDNLDVQQEINNKISSMVTSGEFISLVQPYIPPSVSAWLALNITQPVGVVIDTSLTVAGACADAQATGDAIRKLIHETTYLKHELNPNSVGTISATTLDTDTVQDCVMSPIQNIDGIVSANVLCPFSNGSYWDDYPITSFLFKEVSDGYIEIIDKITFDSTSVSGTSDTSNHYEWRELFFDYIIESTDTYYIALSKTPTTSGTPTVGYKEFNYNSSLDIGSVVGLIGSIKTDVIPQYYPTIYGIDNFTLTKSITSMLANNEIETYTSNARETNTTHVHTDTGVSLGYVNTFPWLTINNKLAILDTCTDPNNTWAILAENDNAFVIMNYNGSKYYITKDISTLIGLAKENIALPCSIFIDGETLQLGHTSLTLTEINNELTTFNVNDTMDNLRLGISCNKNIANTELPYIYSATLDNLKTITPWLGKTGDFLGDSLIDQGYLTGAFNTLYNIIVNNYGISGTTITNINPNNMFYTRIASMSETCDFIYVMGGTNDWGLGAPLGSASNLTYNDYTNFYSALYSTLADLRTKFPNKPIFISTIPQRNWQGGGQASGIFNNGNSVTVMQFNDAIKYISNIYSCIVIDGFESGISLYNLNTYTSDNLHFNTAGGLRFATHSMDVMKQVTPY